MKFYYHIYWNKFVDYSIIFFNQFFQRKSNLFLSITTILSCFPFVFDKVLCNNISCFIGMYYIVLIVLLKCNISCFFFNKGIEYLNNFEIMKEKYPFDYWGNLWVRHFHVWRKSLSYMILSIKFIIY